jgi:hypothetical protein
MKVKAMNSKFMIKSFDRRFLSGILALIFLLTIALSDVTLSQESQDGKQNIARQASVKWMRVGIEQYRRDLFIEAERSFRRARVFQNYLTAAERRQLNEFLANARIGISEGKQAIPSTQTTDKPAEPNQPVEAEVKVEKVVEKVKGSEPSTERGRELIREGPVLIKEGREQTEERAKAEAQLQAQAQAYSALEEQLKAETQARLKAQQEAQAQAKARTSAEEKADSEAAARLEAQKIASQEVRARAKLEEQLRAKAELRAKIEAEAKEAIAATKADAEAKAESYAATIKQIEEKLKVQTEERAKAEAQLQAQAQAYSALEEQLKAETQARSKAQQEERAVKTVEPEAPEIQVEAESSQDDVIVIKDKSFKAEFLRLLARLSQDWRNVLIIGLSALVVLVLISRVRAIRSRPGRKVHKNRVPANSSFIGSRLNEGGGNNQTVKGSKNGGSASTVASNPKRKSFEQPTGHWMEHWKKKHASKVASKDKPSRISGK